MKSQKDLILNAYAKKLRKEQTVFEKRLWYDFLRKCPGHFRRQQVIGHYIADFYSYSAKTVIELDGSQHGEEAAAVYDKKRDEYLKSRGITVLRYQNDEIKYKFRYVCRDIYSKVMQALNANHEESL